MNQPTPADYATLDARMGSADIQIADDGLSYQVTRIFGAPPARVFQAFTDPADLRVWFPSGAPDGTELTTCDADVSVGGRYLYRMSMPEYGDMAWFGEYTAIDHPHRLDATEWFVMGDGEPEGPGSQQTLTFDEFGDGMTLVTMSVRMPDPEDPAEFMEQTAAGLTLSLGALDRLVSAK